MSDTNGGFTDIAEYDTNASPTPAEMQRALRGEVTRHGSLSEIEPGVAGIKITDSDDDIMDRPPLTRKRSNTETAAKPAAKPVYARTRSLYGASPNVRFGPRATIMKNPSNVLSIPDPSRQRLNWTKNPRSVLIIKKISDESIIKPFMELAHWLIQEKHMLVYIEGKVLEEPCVKSMRNYDCIRNKVSTFDEDKDLMQGKVDLIITLGGDGTLLYASNLFQENVPPVMAFHFGSLGFLSPFDFSEYKDKVTQVIKGGVSLCLRTRLKCSVSGPNEQILMMPIKAIESRNHIMVLNEVVVDRGPSPFITNIDLYIEHRFVTSVQGDGVIISTPTGSTAYAAACGASMVHPNVPAIVIAPICPHSLSFRPIIVPAGVEISIRINDDARNGAWCSFDGRNRSQLTKGAVLRISTSIYPVPSICSGDQMSDWFDSLADCLNWNVRRQQKPLQSVSSQGSILNGSS